MVSGKGGNVIRLTIPEIGEEEVQAVAKVLHSGYLVQGEHVHEFERLVAEYVGVRHAVAVSSGTAALHLALLALDIGPADEVIVPDFTFPATANVVELARALYASLGYQVGSLPASEAASREVLSLPMYPELREAQLEEVAGAITRFYRG